MTPQERSALIDQLDRSFQMLPGWAKAATKHAMGAPETNPATGKPFASFREVIEVAADYSLEILRDDFEDNGDLLPAVATQQPPGERKDMQPRIVSRFSCGAASAVATKLVLAEFGAARDVQIINAFIEQEHPDNRRFLADCGKWFGRPITVLRDTKYNASTVEVFRRRMYMAGRNGAPCTKFLKRELMDAYGEPNDVWVLGYTAEEQRRLDAFLDANGERRVLTPLIDRGLGKADCLAMVQRAGIALPMMYRMGYQNANCIGCVKGGEGYWNKIRRDFPDQFEELARVQELIGPSAYLFRDRKTGERYSLRDLPPGKGRYQDEPNIECGVMCEMAERELVDA